MAVPRQRIYQLGRVGCVIHKTVIYGYNIQGSSARFSFSSIFLFVETRQLTENILYLCNLEVAKA